MWLLRELRAQASRLGLALGVVSTGLIAVGTALPMTDEVLSYFRRSALGLDNALIAHAEGSIFVGLAAALIVVLLGYRLAGRLRPLLALAVVGLALATQSAATRVADGDLLHPCAYDPALCAMHVDHPVGFQNLPTGYGFLVIELGAATAFVAGLLLLVPAAPPRRRRRRFAGREDVVWL
jgi:hypothetical protein